MTAMTNDEFAKFMRPILGGRDYNAGVPFGVHMSKDGIFLRVGVEQREIDLHQATVVWSAIMVLMAAGRGPPNPLKPLNLKPRDSVPKPLHGAYCRCGQCNKIMRDR